jgi:uncharacterized membrane protein
MATLAQPRDQENTMKRTLELAKATLVGGVIFLIPLVLTVVILKKAFGIIKVLAQPLDRLLDTDAVAGVAVVDLLTIILMIVLCMLAGLAAASGIGGKAREKIDVVLLAIFPGYGWIKGLPTIVGAKDGAGPKPVIARLDDQTMLGFEVDRNEDCVAIYVPGSPDPRGGTLCYMTPDRVERVDAGGQTVLMKFKDLGVGSTSILKAKDT